MQNFFLRKQPQLKAATQIQEAPSSSTEEAVSALPWYTGQSKRQEEKSQQYHQERVERYHTIHDLASKQVDVASIARQVGLSRQGVYTLSADEAASRTDTHSSGRVGQTLIRTKSISSKDGMRGAVMLSSCIARSKRKDMLALTRPLVALSPPGARCKGEARSFKSVEPTPETMINPDEGKKKRPPTALQVAHWMTFKEEQRLEWQKDYLSVCVRLISKLHRPMSSSRTSRPCLRERKGEQLDSWLKRVEEQGVAELQGFAQWLAERL